MTRSKKTYTHEIRCVEAVGEDIGEMVGRAVSISRATFLRYVDRPSLRRLEANLGYEPHPSEGLTMAADWHVSYHRSRYQGRACVYLCWSAIEHIFTDRMEP